MTSEYTLPTFNIRAVVRETGIKADTIRAWERRYGLPEPARSEGGHRIYSQRDIDILKWLQARKREGLSISRAVDRWERLVADGQDPLREFSLSSTSTAAVTTGSSLEAFRRDWLEAGLKFNESRADVILDQAFAQHTPESVVIGVLEHSLKEVGQLWHEAQVSVQQEHFISELATRTVESLIAGTPPPTLLDTLLVACPPRERHAFPTLLLSYLLRRRGLDVLYLGADVPLILLEQALLSTQPSMGLMAAQRLTTAATLLDTAALLGSYGLQVVYGGLIFNDNPELRSIIPGHFIGEQTAGAADTVMHLLRTSPALPPVEEPADEYVELARRFESMQVRIEAMVAESMPQRTRAAVRSWSENLELGSSILASLRLGSLEALSGHMEWAASLGRHHGVGRESMTMYLSSYRQAMLQKVGGDQTPLAQEIARRIEKVEQA
jgi:DNA-binding transcriptional MerR regulator